MTRRFFTALLIAFTAISLAAAPLIYFAYEQITVAATAIGLTTAKITPAGRPPAEVASCRLETAEIRWTIDNTTPTTTVGTLMEIGEILTLSGHDVLERFLAIRTTGTSGLLNCNYSSATQ